MQQPIKVQKKEKNYRDEKGYKEMFMYIRWKWEEKDEYLFIFDFFINESHSFLL